MQAILASWKTTLLGVCTAIGLLAMDIALPLLDNDATTNPQWQIVVPAMIAAIGLIFARDADKSSRESGVRP